MVFVILQENIFTFDKLRYLFVALSSDIGAFVNIV